MPTWNQKDLDEYNHRRQSTDTKPQPALCDVTLGEVEGEEGYAARFLIRVTCFRCRACDPDNLCPKFLIDCLRYAEIIPDDRPEDVIVTTSQRKVRSRKEERTQIEVIDLGGDPER